MRQTQIGADAAVDVGDPRLIPQRVGPAEAVVMRPDRIDARAFVTDIAPTLLERAGVATQSDERVPISGRSLSGLLSGAAATVRSEDDVIGIEVSGNSALYRGAFKLMRNQPRWGDGQWRLFNIETDPGETQDLAQSQPELFASMREAYDAYARANGVLELPPGYDPQTQVAHNTRMKSYQHYWYIYAGLALVALLILGGVIWLALRLFRKRPA